MGTCAPEDAARLQANGFSPLAAAALCSRGYADPDGAAAMLDAARPMPDPFLLRDMDLAVERVRRAIAGRERIAVYGDYDVDGITATCLLTEFFQSEGADCVYYIPGRMEEGYGLNAPAVRQLAAQGVRLIVTVDCGITALEEARLCRELGIDLIVTDHHECKESLPQAVAVVNPHRRDDGYPHQELAGVGVAFKLAAAICGDQEGLLPRCCDLLCLGTVADVMPLLGENRRFAAAGLRRIGESPRIGVAALMQECGCSRQNLTAGAVGYILAPRINAAGRMGQVDLAVKLFLTKSPREAAFLAGELCRLNRRRQAVESEIYDQAVAMLDGETGPAAIVLAGERWHQGVVGIVASRLAEEYRCPTFLICLDGERGKASSRSYGGFNLFSALEALGDRLESYGGHELAAGFTIARDQIAGFRREVTARADSFRRSGLSRAALEVDCMVEPGLLTLPNVEALDQLEPCGAGCPRPVFALDRVTVDQMSEVGGGKHLRLRLRCEGRFFNAIFFSTTARQAATAPGEEIEVAFTPQVNEFHGSRTVQLNLVDLRPPARVRDRELYRRHCGGALTAWEAELLLPGRQEFVAVWSYLVANSRGGFLEDECGRMSDCVSRRIGIPGNLVRTRICLDVFAEQGLIDLRQSGQAVSITLTSEGRKVNLDESRIIARLRQQKAGEL